jgi:hypothetical protein
MMKKSIVMVLFFMFVLPFFVADKAEAIEGWKVCSMVRIGVNADHGFAYMELTAAGPNTGEFSNIIFQIDESIRKESEAVALTALSLEELLRVNVSALTNSYGYQILRAVYIYVP